MTLMLLIRLLRCITTPLLFLIAAVPVKIFILSLGNLTTPLLLEWMVSPAWWSRELRILLAQSCLIFSILVSLLTVYLMPGSYLELFLFSSLVILTLLPIKDPSLFNPSAANFLKRLSYPWLRPPTSQLQQYPLLTDNLVSCQSHLPPMLWPLPSMNRMATWKDAKVLPWPSLICQRILTVCRIVPSSQTSCCRCCRSTTFLVQVLPFL